MARVSWCWWAAAPPPAAVACPPASQPANLLALPPGVSMLSEQCCHSTPYNAVNQLALRLSSSCFSSWSWACTSLPPLMPCSRLGREAPCEQPHPRACIHWRARKTGGQQHLSGCQQAGVGWKGTAAAALPPGRAAPSGGSPAQPPAEQLCWALNCMVTLHQPLANNSNTSSTRLGELGSGGQRWVQSPPRSGKRVPSGGTTHQLYCCAHQPGGLTPT